MQLANIVRLHIGKHAQHNVGAWANSQRRALLGEPAHKSWVSIAAHAVVDAIDLEGVEGVSDILGSAFLTSVSDGTPSIVTARDCKRSSEF